MFNKDHFNQFTPRFSSRNTERSAVLTDRSTAVPEIPLEIFPSGPEEQESSDIISLPRQKQSSFLKMDVWGESAVLKALR